MSRVAPAAMRFSTRTAQGSDVIPRLGRGAFDQPVLPRARHGSALPLFAVIPSTISFPLHARFNDLRGQ